MLPALDAPTLAEGRYSLTRRLGEGGMAAVFLGWDNKLKVWRAIKVLLPAIAAKPKLRKRFENEAHAMARLEHPNIVRVYDVGIEDRVPYMVMELAEGGCIIDWLARFGAMPGRLAVDVTVQICKGIRAAHEAGIVHRDIKPHNVLVNRKGMCKVTDFGIAQLMDIETLTQTGSVMGTWGFMAPEQRTDAKAVDERADVFSIGATLYCLLTNRTPTELYVAEPEDEMFKDIAVELLPIVLKACRYKASDRYPDVKSLALDLHKAGQTQPQVTAPSLILSSDPLPDSIELAPLSPTVANEVARALGRGPDASLPDEGPQPARQKTPPDAPTPASKIERKVLPYYMSSARPPKGSAPPSGARRAPESGDSRRSPEDAGALPSYIDEQDYQRRSQVERASTPAPARPAVVEEAPVQESNAAADLILKLAVIPLMVLFVLLVTLGVGMIQVNGAHETALEAQSSLFELLVEQNSTVDALHQAGAERQVLVDSFYGFADADPRARPAAALAYVKAVESEMLEHSGSPALTEIKPTLDELLERRDAMVDTRRTWADTAVGLPGSLAVALGVSMGPPPLTRRGPPE